MDRANAEQFSGLVGNTQPALLHFTETTNTPSFTDVNLVPRHASMEPNGGTHPIPVGGVAAPTTDHTCAQSTNIQQAPTAASVLIGHSEQQKSPVKPPFSIDYLLSPNKASNNSMMSGNESSFVSNDSSHQADHAPILQETVISRMEKMTESSPQNAVLNEKLAVEPEKEAAMVIVESEVASSMASNKPEEAAAMAMIEPEKAESTAIIEPEAEYNGLTSTALIAKAPIATAEQLEQIDDVINKVAQGNYSKELLPKVHLRSKKPKRSVSRKPSLQTINVPTVMAQSTEMPLTETATTPVVEAPLPAPVSALSSASESNASQNTISNILDMFEPDSNEPSSRPRTIQTDPALDLLPNPMTAATMKELRRVHGLDGSTNKKSSISTSRKTSNSSVPSEPPTVITIEDSDSETLTDESKPSVLSVSSSPHANPLATKSVTDDSVSKSLQHQNEIVDNSSKSKETKAAVEQTVQPESESATSSSSLDVRAPDLKPEPTIVKTVVPEKLVSPVASNKLENGLSIDAYFLALTTEVRGQYSTDREGLHAMVLAKQRELDAAALLKAQSSVEQAVDVELEKKTEQVQPAAQKEETALMDEISPKEEIVTKEDVAPVIETEMIKNPEPSIETVLLNTISSAGDHEDSVANDLKKLENEIEKDLEEHAAPAKRAVTRKPPSKKAKKAATPRKKGQSNRSKKSKNSSDTDTESLTEESEEDSDEYYDQLDVDQAVQLIDMRCKEQEKTAKTRKTRTSERASSTGQEPSTSESDGSSKRKSSQTSEDPPAKRRSARLKTNTSHNFFSTTAVTEQTEQRELPESSRDDNLKVTARTVTPKKIQKISQRAKRAALKKVKPVPRRASMTPPAAFILPVAVTLPVPVASENVPSPSDIRRPRFRTEYTRRVSDETLATLLSQVLTPAAPKDMEILDHFNTPIVRRAIVNRNTLCYAISLVQLMLRVPQIYSIIRSHAHVKRENEEDCFLCMLGGLISDRPRSNDDPEFVSVLKTTWTKIDTHPMHCIMEAMQHFFNRIDEEYTLDHPDYIGKSLNLCSPLRNFFYVHSIHTYRCTWCSYERSMADRDIHITVDLLKKSDGTLQSMVNNSALPYVAKGIHCPHCQAPMTNAIHYTKFSEILLVFVPRVRTKRKEKDMSVVTVQNNMTMQDDHGVHQYSLCSFIVHYGQEGDRGHYKAFEVDRSDGFQYNEFDDARVHINARLCRDNTIVLAMFRKTQDIAKDSPTDIVFDGRGNVRYADEKHCKQD